MLKFLYIILTNPLGLPINPIWEYIILFVVGEVVHEIAWHVSPGGQFGSVIYWITKLIAFVAIWAILYGIIWIAQFVYTNIWWIVLCLGAIAIVLTIVRICVEYSMKHTDRESK